MQTMYSSIKKDSLVTVANAKALTETSETTSNTAIFNTTISQSDSDVNSSIHSKEKNNTKFSITEDMSEQERYKELKDKSIVVSKPDMSKVSGIDIEAYKNLSTKEAKSRSEELRKCSEYTMSITKIAISNLILLFRKAALIQVLIIKENMAEVTQIMLRCLSALTSLLKTQNL